jgi:hypothetical protein
LVETSTNPLHTAPKARAEVLSDLPSSDWRTLRTLSALVPPTSRAPSSHRLDALACFDFLELLQKLLNALVCAIAPAAVG